MKHAPLLCVLALSLTACATVPVPTNLLLAAEQSVQRADISRGTDLSPDELKSARIKLTAARDAVAQRKMQVATRFAEEARLDADYATARLEAAKAQFNVEAMKKGNEALRQQALRDSVNVAPIAIPVPITDSFVPMGSQPPTGN